MQLPVSDQFSNFGYILPCFRDITGFMLKKLPLFHMPPLLHMKSADVFLGLDANANTLC